MLFLLGLSLYQVFLCIFLSMLPQASNMVSGLCCEYVPFTSASLCVVLSVALKAKATESTVSVNFHLTSHPSVENATEFCRFWLLFS